MNPNDELRPDELTDEQLDAALSDNQGSDKPESPAPDAAPASADEAPADADKAPVETTDAEAAQADPVEQLRKELEALRNEHVNLRSAFGRQANELGIARQQLARTAKPDEANKPTAEEFMEDPAKATEKLIEAKEQAKLDQMRQAHEQLMQVHTTVTSAIPTFTDDLPEVVKMLADQDKADPEDLNRFKQNPYVMGPATLYHMTKRVHAARELAKANAELTKLKTELEQARKAPGKIAAKINAGTRAAATPTKAPPATLNPGLSGLSTKDISAMSIDQLEAALKEAEEQGV